MTNARQRLEQVFTEADLRSPLLEELLLRVLERIATTTGSDELRFGVVREGDTAWGDAGEVRDNGDIHLSPEKLRGHDLEVAMAIVAHELAHQRLRHFEQPLHGRRQEAEADALAAAWGFDVEAFRARVGPPRGERG